MNCIRCRTKPAKFREADEASRVYCSQECFYIGLKGDDDVVGLVTSDGVEFRVPREIAVQLKTVAYLIEDAGVDDWIPLPQIDGKTLDKILQLLKDEETQDEFLNKFEASLYLDAEKATVKMFPKFVEIMKGTTDSNVLRRFKSQVNLVAYYNVSQEFLNRCKEAGIDTKLAERIHNKVDDDRLIVAVKEGVLEHVKFLISMGETDRYSYLVDISIRVGSLDVTKYLISQGFKFPRSTSSFVNIETIEYLLSRGLIGRNDVLASIPDLKDDMIIEILNRGILDKSDIPLKPNLLWTRGVELVKRLFDRDTFDDSSDEMKDAFRRIVSYEYEEMVSFLLEEGLFQKDEDFIFELLSTLTPLFHEDMMNLLYQFLTPKRAKMSQRLVSRSIISPSSGACPTEL